MLSSVAARTHTFRQPPLRHRFPRFILFQIMNKRLFQIGGVILRHQFIRCAHRQHAAFVHEGDAVAAFGLVHKMGGDEYGDFVFARQLQQRAPEHIAGGGIDAGSRFVENQHFGVVQAGGGQLQALADA